jgi:hypothetical protein
MTTTLFMVAYAAIGLLCSFLVAKRDPEVESPGWALFLGLFFWPLLLVFGVLVLICRAFEVAGEFVGFEKVYGDDYW